jgi:hypothetical protein
MSTYLNSVFLMTSQIALLFTLPAASAQDTNKQANWPTSTAIQTEAGHQIPAGAFGVVQINTPRVATLLQLRGVLGRGTVVLKSGETRDCLTLPIRFVAGDFGGDGISAQAAKPIRLIIRSARVANALAAGDDVVSDMYRISSVKDDTKADIIIQGGLSESHGFVLNPGNSIAADVFGATAKRTACSEL